MIRTLIDTCGIWIVKSPRDRSSNSACEPKTNIAGPLPTGRFAPSGWDLPAQGDEDRLRPRTHPSLRRSVGGLIGRQAATLAGGSSPRTRVGRLRPRDVAAVDRCLRLVPS